MASRQPIPAFLEPTVTAVNEAVTRSEDAANLSRHVWLIRGAATAGKTAVLEAVRDYLTVETDLTPIHVAPPLGALDTGPQALVDIALGLLAGGRVEAEQLEPIANPGMEWVDKLTTVRRWLIDAQPVVLLCEEPNAWTASDTSHFNRRAGEVVELVLDGTGSQAVVTSTHGIPAGIKALDEWPLTAQSDPATMFAERRLAPFSAVTSVLLDRAPAELKKLSSLDLRLLVAYGVVTSPEQAVQVVRTTVRRPIADYLLQHLATSTDTKDIFGVWERLALARRPFTKGLLEAVDFFKLGNADRDFIERLLLVTRDGRLVVHNSLRTDARRLRRSRDDDPCGDRMREAHHALSDFYLGELKGRSLPEQIPSAMEAFHHATRAVGGDHRDSRLEKSPVVYFTDQLNMLGYIYSTRFDDYERAAEIYSEVLRYAAEHADGPENASLREPYAAHYRAFNLDVLGEEPREVEALYQASLISHPNNAVWRARFICFLIVLGRLDDARMAWLDAVQSLFPADSEPNVEDYRALHVPVVVAALSRGYLEFAGDVIDDVPRHLTFSDLDTLRRRVEIRHVADLFGSIRPDASLHDRWWLHAPASLAQPLRDAPLRRWMAGRVVAVEDDIVALHAAEVEVGEDGMESERPRLATVRLARPQFEEWSQDHRAPVIDDYVEIGIYGDGDAAAVRIDYPHAPDVPDVFPATLDPDRYLRRTGWISSNSPTS